MKINKILGYIGISICMIMAVTGCSRETSDLPDMASFGEITAISREEGSGTKAEFESLIGTSGKGTDQIALSTEEMLDQIQSGENTIGYLAYSSARDCKDVRILSVDGIEASEKSIENGKYPLCRNYYLAYSGELSELEHDFITYVTSAGQALVAENCLPAKADSTFLSDQSSGEITINGSSSVAPLMKQLAEDYYNYNPNAQIFIEVTDSTSGLTSAIRGECDLAMSSRSLKDYEAELLETETIALDGVAVVVNKTNPLENLTKKQIREIYDGSVNVWSNLK